MTAADAPELLSLAEIRECVDGGESVVFTTTMLAAYDDSGRLWRDVAADLAEKLAAAERERDKAKAHAVDVGARNSHLAARADRAVAALAAAQEAMRERAALAVMSRADASTSDCEARSIEWDTGAANCRLERRGGDCLCADRLEQADFLADAIRALPIPAAKLEGE